MFWKPQYQTLCFDRDVFCEEHERLARGMFDSNNLAVPAKQHVKWKHSQRIVPQKVVLYGLPPFLQYSFFFTTVMIQWKTRNFNRCPVMSTGHPGIQYMRTGRNDWRYENFITKSGETPTKNWEYVTRFRSVFMRLWLDRQALLGQWFHSSTRAASIVRSPWSSPKPPFIIYLVSALLGPYLAASTAD